MASYLSPPFFLNFLYLNNKLIMILIMIGLIFATSFFFFTCIYLNNKLIMILIMIGLIFVTSFFFFTCIYLNNKLIMILIMIGLIFISSFLKRQFFMLCAIMILSFLYCFLLCNFIITYILQKLNDMILTRN